MVCRIRGLGVTLEWRRNPLLGSDLRRVLSSVASPAHWADMDNVVTKLSPNHVIVRALEIPFAAKSQLPGKALPGNS
jgi:hypothetical protein